MEQLGRLQKVQAAVLGVVLAAIGWLLFGR
jgi:hypothetical protein